MIKILFPPQKYDYVFIRGLVCRKSKQVMVDFLLDTGASTTMIDPDIMKSIGYSESCEEYVKPATVSGPLKNFHYCIDHKNHVLTLKKHMAIEDTGQGNFI